MEYLVSFPRLEVLILEEGGMGLFDEDVKQRIVLPSCQRSPLLKQVITHRRRHFRHYTMFIIVLSNERTRTEVTAHIRQYENDPNRLWWTRYDAYS